MYDVKRKAVHVKMYKRWGVETSLKYKTKLKMIADQIRGDECD